MTDSLVPVEVGVCRCPGTPHPDGDVVYLYPKLGLEAGIAVQTALAIGEDASDKLRRMYAALIDYGIADWTFTAAGKTNGKAEKLPINPATIRGALPWMEGGSVVATAAFKQYGEVVTSPLARQPSRPTPTGKSSKRGPTKGTSTSPAPDS